MKLFYQAQKHIIMNILWLTVQGQGLLEQSSEFSIYSLPKVLRNFYLKINFHIATCISYFKFAFLCQLKIIHTYSLACKYMFILNRWFDQKFILHTDPEHLYQLACKYAVFHKTIKFEAAIQSFILLYYNCSYLV